MHRQAHACPFTIFPLCRPHKLSPPLPTTHTQHTQGYLHVCPSCGRLSQAPRSSSLCPTHPAMLWSRRRRKQGLGSAAASALLLLQVLTTRAHGPAHGHTNKHGTSIPRPAPHFDASLRQACAQCGRVSGLIPFHQHVSRMCLRMGVLTPDMAL
jgi:ribosomal protein S14